MSSDAARKDIVIIGGGIIGACTAYYLLNSSSFNPSTMSVTLIEESGIASGSSGKAGGFLASDWHGPRTASLGQLSFNLHVDLAEEHDGANQWGFDMSPSYSLKTNENRSEMLKMSKEHYPHDIKPHPALRRSALGSSRIQNLTPAIDNSFLNRVDVVEKASAERTTAQVNPYYFTRYLFCLARKKGLKYFRGNPTNLEKDQFDTPTQLTFQRTEPFESEIADGDSPVEEELSPDNEKGERDEVKQIPCSHLMIAAGPWSGIIVSSLQIFPPNSNRGLPVSTIAGHSVLLRHRSLNLSPATYFTTIVGRGSSDIYTGYPELLTRPNGEIYISGENGGATLPQFSRDSKVMVQEDLVDKLLKSARLMSSELVIGEEDEVQGCDMLKTSVCFRPTSPDESPIMGALTDNVFACAGHGPWGISFGPGSGLLMAELILEGNFKSANVSALSPQRFFHR